MSGETDWAAASPEILLAPPGAGKTEFALQLLCEVLETDGWPQVWVLLPNGLQVQHLRQRLFARADGRNQYFNLFFLQFNELAQRLLQMSGNPARIAGQAGRQGMLRTLLNDLARAGELQVFGGIADTPGLLRAIGDFLDELQRKLVTPEAFAAAAVSERDRELALIARRYRSYLSSHGYQDNEGANWLALEALGGAALRGELARVDFLLVDGFDQFSPLQSSTLMQLANCVRRALITLPAAPGREEGVGERFRKTLALLQQYSQHQLQVVSLPARPEAPQQGLQQLAERIFRQDAKPLPALQQLQLVEAPGPAQEARALTRRIKQLLLETEAQPEDCLIAVRDWQRYARHLRAAGREHGVPLALQRGETLAEIPTILSLVKLLQLPAADFPRQASLDVLNAPCFSLAGLGQEQVALLEQISRERRLRAGREAWLAAVRASDYADSEALTQSLIDFMDAVTPPQEGDKAGLWGWLRRLCGLDTDHDPDAYTLDMRACLPPEDSGQLRERETAALAALDKLLRDRSRATQLNSAAQHDFEFFMRELRAALAVTRLEVCRSSAVGVLVAPASEACGLPQRHVFIPGLSAGIFPGQQPVDPLHLGSERKALAERGADLGARPVVADDALFFQLLGQARESLMITRPTVENGTPLVASHLWQALRRVCPQQSVTHIRPGAVASAREVASAEEALVALAAQPDAAGSASLRRWLQQEQGGLLAQVAHAGRVESGRLSRYSALNKYSGVLADERLIAQVAADLGPQRVWSATQLGDLGACRYRFFASRLLELEKLWQPETGLNALELGTLNHGILERVYSELEQRELTIEPEHLDEALSTLECSAQEVFDEAALILERPLDEMWPWQQRIMHARLETFIRLDFTASGPVSKRLPGAGRRVRWQELSFGRDGDRLSIPLVVEGQHEDLRLQGVVDRIDEVEGQLLVLDYKSGSSAIPQDDLVEGVNVQMLIYLRAVEQLLATHEVAGGMYLHLRNQKSSGWIKLDANGERILQIAEGRIAENIAAARRGDFRVEPRRPDNGKCTRYCEFSELCRVRVTQGPLQEPA